MQPTVNGPEISLSVKGSRYLKNISGFKSTDFSNLDLSRYFDLSGCEMT